MHESMQQDDCAADDDHYDDALAPDPFLSDPEHREILRRHREE